MLPPTVFLFPTVVDMYLRGQESFNYTLLEKTLFCPVNWILAAICTIGRNFNSQYGRSIKVIILDLTYYDLKTEETFEQSFITLEPQWLLAILNALGDLMGQNTSVHGLY